MPFSKPIYHFIQMNQFYIIIIPREIAYFGPQKLFFLSPLKHTTKKWGAVIV